MNFLNERDPKKALKQFTKEVFGGKMRWLFAFFAILTSGFIVYLIIFKEELEVDYPIHVKGKAAWAAMIFALIIWNTLTIISWKKWKKDRPKNNL